MGNLKPYIKNIVYNSVYKYRYLNTSEKRQVIKSNVRYKNLFSGQRCFVIGNGPSLRQQNLIHLKNEHVFMVNQSMRMPVYDKIQPEFHVLADPRYYNLDKEKPEDKEVIDLIRSLNRIKEQICFFPINAYEFVKENHLEDQLHISYFMAANTLYEGCTREVDLANTIYAVPTVVQFAVQIAIYMGFTEIYLLGCDMTGFEEIRNTDNSMQSTYAYELTENEKKRMMNSTMHSGEELFYAYARDYTAYRLLNGFCKSKQIQIFNATEGGLLDNIKRVKYDSLFDKGEIEK